MGLSGGQRLSVARGSILEGRPILVLDDDKQRRPTRCLAKGAGAKPYLVLVVAHHLSTIRSADQITVMQQENRSLGHPRAVENGRLLPDPFWEQGAKTEVVGHERSFCVCSSRQGDIPILGRAAMLSTAST